MNVPIVSDLLQHACAPRTRKSEHAVGKNRYRKARRYTGEQPAATAAPANDRPQPAATPKRDGTKKPTNPTRRPQQAPSVVVVQPAAQGAGLGHYLPSLPMLCAVGLAVAIVLLVKGK